jgi:hypothetical protein
MNAPRYLELSDVTCSAVEKGLSQDRGRAKLVENLCASPLDKELSN